MKIAVETKSWDEVGEALEKSAVHMNAQHFGMGASSDYASGIRRFREFVLPKFREKLEKKDVLLRFRCSPVHLGGLSLFVVVSGLEVRIFNAFFDTYTAYYARGTALGYISQQIDFAWQALDGIKLLE